jgi:hypothetical protein
VINEVVETQMTIRIGVGLTLAAILTFATALTLAACGSSATAPPPATSTPNTAAAGVAASTVAASTASAPGSAEPAAFCAALGRYDKAFNGHTRPSRETAQSVFNALEASTPARSRAVVDELVAAFGHTRPVTEAQFHTADLTLRDDLAHHCAG